MPNLRTAQLMQPGAPAAGSRALDVPVPELPSVLGPAYGPMSAKDLRQLAAYVEKAANDIGTNPIKIGNDV